MVLLDYSSYEHALLSAWEDEPSSQRGFDWEIEKVRRSLAGLRREDGSAGGAWVRTPSIFDFLVTHSPSRVVGYDAAANGGGIGTRYEPPPKPVNPLDVAVLVAKNLLNGLGFGPSLGMAAVPNAVIQKYEGSYLTFIRGVLGGDLQTLAGGPLFLLLAKYYQVHGPIFNLSFGPKSFLVISDPVMARHILRDSSPEQYCKGMLAEILEPIMGDGLIPADPKIWKVSSWLVRSVRFFWGGVGGGGEGFVVGGGELRRKREIVSECIHHDMKGNIGVTWRRGCRRIVAIAWKIIRVECCVYGDIVTKERLYQSPIHVSRPLFFIVIFSIDIYRRCDGGPSSPASTRSG